MTQRCRSLVLLTLLLLSTAVIAQPVTPPQAAVSAPAATTPVAVPSAPATTSATAPAPVRAGAHANAVLPQDLSFYGMIANADWVVKGVIAGLAFASVLTWTIALAKAVELGLSQRSARQGLAGLHRAATLDEAASLMRDGACARLVAAARTEVEASGGMDPDGVKERTAWRLERLVAAEGRTMNRGTGLLATIGSTSPFVGLFGTVWGIMNSFIGISQSQTTNLAVVAPGIAEALLATAVGLVAAIPAVVIYNMFARATAAGRARLADAVSETMRLLSRDLGRGIIRSGASRLHAAE